MKKTLCLILCLFICIGLCACEKEPEEVTLTADNINDYVTVDLSFGDVDIDETTIPLTDNSRYYLSCSATLSIKPKGNYTFTNTSCDVLLAKGGKWLVSTKSDTKYPNDLSISVPNSDGIWFKTTAKYRGTINLDKNGYGEKNISLYQYSTTKNNIEKLHPSAIEWYYPIKLVNGTITAN